MQTHTEYIRHTNRSERDHVLYCYSFIVDESDRTIIYGFVEKVVRKVHIPYTEISSTCVKYFMCRPLCDACIPIARTYAQ